MTIVQRFNTTAAMLAALSASFILLAASVSARAGDRGHRSMASASGHVANSPPIIAKPGHDDHGHRDRHGRHRHGFIFDYAQTNYWLIDNACEVRRIHPAGYPDGVIVLRVKPCAATSTQVVTVPGY